MRALVLTLGLAVVAACGGAASIRGTPEPSATAEVATITPAGTVTATAITGTIVPGVGTIPRDWKMLTPLPLAPVSAGFHSLAIFSSAPNSQQGSRVDGTIDQRGAITIASRTPSGPPPCPICLARGTRIATPTGEIAVEDLRVGDAVWTVDASGTRVAAPLVTVGSTPVPSTHQVVRLILSDGRAVSVSP